VLVRHRHPTRRREIDDREPAMRETHAAFDMQARIIGPAMGEPITRSAELVGIDGTAVDTPDAYDPAHAMGLSRAPGDGPSCNP